MMFTMSAMFAASIVRDVRNICDVHVAHNAHDVHNVRENSFDDVKLQIFVANRRIIFTFVGKYAG